MQLCSLAQSKRQKKAVTSNGLYLRIVLYDFRYQKSIGSEVEEPDFMYQKLNKLDIL